MAGARERRSERKNEEEVFLIASECKHSSIQICPGPCCFCRGAAHIRGVKRNKKMQILSILMFR